MEEKKKWEEEQKEEEEEELRALQAQFEETQISDLEEKKLFFCVACNKTFKSEKQ